MTRYFKLILYAKGARGSYQAPGSVDLDLRDGVEWSGEETQDSLALLRKGMNRLIENISSINPSFVDLVELLTLLTTQVENLHAVSHFKHETFNALNYSQDFGTIVKESLKRITKWAAKYFTHDRSYYPVPDTSMPLSALSTMALPAVQRVTKKDEAVMKEWMENYRPVRQRTVRSETTEDKAGACLFSGQAKRTFLCGV